MPVDVERVAREALRMMEVERPIMQSAWSQEVAYQKSAEAAWLKGKIHMLEIKQINQDDMFLMISRF